MRGLQRRLPDTRTGRLLAAYCTVALVFGGGGSPSAAAEIIVQLAFAAAALACLWWAAPEALAGRAPPRLLLAFAAALAALPLVQLIPLPAGLWQALPGRAREAAALAAVGAAGDWQPLSVAPSATLAGLLALLPALGAMLAATLLSRQDRRAIVLLVALLAVAATVVGVLQMASGPGRFRLYEITHAQWLVGFHASRNSAADGLLIGMLALTAWFATAVQRRPLLRSDIALVAIVHLFLFMGLFLTGSRAGIVLVVPVLLVEYAMLRCVAAAPQLSQVVLGLAGLIGLVSVAASPAAGNARIAGVLARFDATRDSRFDLWQDTMRALDAFWPAGSGVGTFSHAFLPFERLAVLDDLFPNRAHNEYLEFALETGLLAPLLLAAGAWVAWRLGAAAWRAARSERPLVLFAGGTIMVIALHALVDYPLRNMAVASVAGVALGLLAAIASDGRSESGSNAG